MVMLATTARPTPRLVREGGREYWSTGWHVIEWIERWGVLTNAEWTGQPFVLLPWQRRTLLRLFETDAEGRRIYRRALIGIPRKNGKTELAAALALYLVAADGEPSAEVYCAASSEDQAKLVFEAARRMVEMGPLRDVFEVGAERLTLKEDRYSFLQRLSSRGSSWHGLNIHGVILDELHTWTTDQQSELWAALTTASAARRQPMQVAITTAGEDLKHSRCGHLYRLGRAVEAGKQEAPGFYFEWWEAPDHLDYRDPAAWRAANPSLGVTVREEHLRDELGSCSEADFRRLHLNQWVQASQKWLPPGAWEACIGDARLEPGAPTWAGWDASTKYDSSAIVAVQVDAEGRFVVQARVWSRPLDLSGAPLADWRMPLGEMGEYLRSLAVRYDLRGVAYDPAFVSWAAADLEAEGLPMIEWPQSDSRMVPATRLAYELVVQRRLVHSGDPVLAAHVADAAPHYTRSGGSRLRKSHTGAQIDAAVALLMALALASAEVGDGEEPEADGPSLFVFGE
jgi:phage terminase large subunit-like protein